MQIQTHLLSGWLGANLTASSAKDRFLIMLSGVICDLDGLSIIGGYASYGYWHHRLGHNLLWVILGSLILSSFADKKKIVLITAIIVGHLHLLMDLLGSGPGWGIYYLWPFNETQQSFSFSWALDSWQNISTDIFLIACAIIICFKQKRFIFEYPLPKLDKKIVNWLTNYKKSS